MQIRNQQMCSGNALPWIVQVRQILKPRRNSTSKMIYSHLHSKHTSLKRLPVIIDANASAKPAVEALMLGVTRHIIPITAMMTEESKLKRTESQRLTTQGGESTNIQRTDLTGHTSPQPVDRVGILQSS
jgi:GTP-binding protein EngB required for normal cell division